MDYEPDKLLKLFTEYFKQNYGVECIAALHHNKRKTNYHIHLIFSERKLLEEPMEKIATRNMFYDENGKHVRTKKEVLDEAGLLRKGCRIIPKGEVYERNIFTIKDSRFKSDSFLDEVKRSYTDLINIYVKDDKDKLKVFDKTGVYLPTKKIGKNNPKAELVKADNEVRAMWNQTVDRALVSGVPEVQIMNVKQSEIGRKTRTSIQKNGKNPAMFKNLIMTAIYARELLINRLFKVRAEKSGKMPETLATTDEELTAGKVASPLTADEKAVPAMPVKSEMASKFHRLEDIYQKLNKQNIAIYEREQQLCDLEQKLLEVKGIFKAKERKALQEQMQQIHTQISNMKRYLPTIVQGYGYKNVKEFLAEYKASKAEYGNYRKSVAEWEKMTGEKVDDSLKAKLQQRQHQIKEQNSRNEHHRKTDRGAK